MYADFYSRLGPAQAQERRHYGKISQDTWPGAYPGCGGRSVCYGKYGSFRGRSEKPSIMPSLKFNRKKGISRGWLIPI